MDGLALAGRQVRNFARSFRHEPPAVPVSPRELVDPRQPKDWTVLAWMDGRDRLAHSVEVALNGMEEIGSTDRVNLVAQATLAPELGDRRFMAMGEVDTRRYYLTRDADRARVTSPVLAETKEAPSLEDFLAWGVRNFPARRYAVVLKKHGLGFAKDGQQVQLSAREVRQALENVERRTGVKPDVLVWDSCSMQQLEVAYELKDRAGAMTGSPERIRAVEFPYPTLLHNLTKDAEAHDARTVGDTVVRSYGVDAPSSTQAAADLGALGPLAERTRELVRAVLEEQVPREQLYTDMMKSGSFEPRQTLALAYNFRDFGGFLDHVAADASLSERVRSAARAAREALKAVEYSTHLDPHLARAKGVGSGTSAFLPWKDPSPSLMEGYRELAWCKDTGWDRLLDYVLEGEAAAPREGSPPLGPGKLGLYAYKKFVSPYLVTSCSYDVSCSQYAREAVEDRGLWEGGRRAFMRVLACDDGPGPDPADHHHHDHAPLPAVVLHPPAAVDKSAVRKRVEGALFAGARMAGRLVGGLVAAAVGAPVGAVLGGFWGARAGRGDLDRFNAGVRERYGDHQARSLEKLQRRLTGPAEAVRARFGGVAGAVAGALTGGAMGLVGGGLFAGRFFGGFAGVGLQNAAKAAVGELPPHYRTEQILRRDYLSRPA